MAENRVTAETLEVGVVRASVPGDARVTSEVLEVAMVRVDPSVYTFARVSAEVLEVAIMRSVIRLRSRAYLL